METLLEVLAGLIPSVGVGLLFFLAIRSLVNADRNERAALARLDAQLKAEKVAQGEAPSST
ncbi:MAG: hypothetical protein M3Y46_05660 [Actinomycetota bacterium]|nr:hypothetical protein [Actinomycetota bacterium]